MPIGAVRLSLKRSESRCKQQAVIEDVDKGSYGETRMKKVNKEDSKENGGRNWRQEVDITSGKSFGVNGGNATV